MSIAPLGWLLHLEVKTFEVKQYSVDPDFIDRHGQVCMREGETGCRRMNPTRQPSYMVCEQTKMFDYKHIEKP